VSCPDRRDTCVVCERVSDALIENAALNEAEICRRAGISREALVEHLGGIEGCLAVAFERGVNILYERAAAAFQAPGAWETRLRAALLAVVSQIAERPGLGRLCYVDGVELGGPEVWRRRERARQRFVQLLAHDQDRERPPLRFELVVGAVNVAMRRHVIEQETWQDAPAIAERIAEQALIFEPVAA
jgi:AcrR family transcriptional regulator